MWYENNGHVHVHVYICIAQLAQLEARTDKSEKDPCFNKLTRQTHPRSGHSGGLLSFSVASQTPMQLQYMYILSDGTDFKDFCTCTCRSTHVHCTCTCTLVKVMIHVCTRSIMHVQSTGPSLQ